MKTYLKVALVLLFAGVISAHADEKKPVPDEHVQSSKINQANSNESLMMKIDQDEKGDVLRRKAFIEELRKLYKANFL